MKKVFFIPLVSLLMFSCQKENVDYFVTYTDNPLNNLSWASEVPASAPVNEIAGLLSKPAAYDSFVAATGAGVHLSDLDINVPQNTCILADGTPVTGVVRLAIRQFRKKGDFIRYGKPTNSYGRLIESAGAFDIAATNNGQEVFIRPGKKVGLVFKEANPATDMKVFYGKENLHQPQPEGTNDFTWALATDSAHVSTFSTGSFSGYNVMTGSWKLSNCARFTDTAAPKTYVTAILPANFTNLNTIVYAVSKEKNTVVRLIDEPATKSFYAPNVPLNSRVLIVSMSLMGGQLYLGTNEITVTSDIIVSLNPALTATSEISSLLDAL